MKFQIQRDNLLNSMQQIIGAVEKRQTMPALSNVLIIAGTDSLSLTATDLEIEFLTNQDMVIDQPGEITVPARKLLDICKSLPADSLINFSLKDDKAMIQSGRSRFSLVTLPASEFPSLDEISSNSSFEIPQATLKDIIDKTAFAMAQQDVRYYLNGLMLEVGPKTLRAVATDGHRLAFCEKETDFELAEIKQVILPRKGVIELARLLDNSNDKIRIMLSSNHLRVELNNIRFTSKLIDGRFPDYNRVIPDDGNSVMTAERETLKQALIRASILSNEKYRGIRLILEDNLVRLQAHNPDQEEADVDLEVNYKGETLEIGFNVNYMIDALNATNSEMVQLTLRDSNSSCLLSYPDLGDCKYVIMPMRL